MAHETPSEKRDSATKSHIAQLELATVWECRDPDQADAILGGEQSGFVYRRDGHPNAVQLAETVNQWQRSKAGIVVSSGMGAIAVGLLSSVAAGEHVLLSNRLYGKTTRLVISEASKLGITASIADFSMSDKIAAALRPQTKLLIGETLANPRLETFDLAAVAQLAHSHGAELLVDNTFATPLLCRPLELGADWVVESLTKFMNGHSDVMLGYLGASRERIVRAAAIASTWGYTASPLECWMASRSLGTFELRMERACANAIRAAEFLAHESRISGVDFPGLPSHAAHALAEKQFAGRFGNMIAFHLPTDRDGIARFLVASGIPFCPSLGTLHSSVSHPESTSHRGMNPEERTALGIHAGTLRLSVGIETADDLLQRLAAGIAAV